MQTSHILNAVQKVIAAVDSKSVVAQTDHLIFSDGFISAYNGKISISTPVEMDLEFSVPANDLYKILKSVDDKEVQLFLEDDVLHIVSDKVRATLSTEVEEEAALLAIRKFELDDLYDGKSDQIPDNFIEAIGLAIYSASKNADQEDNLNCICVDGKKVTAGDGYRATEIELSSSMKKVLIPLSSAIELRKFIPTDYIISGGWMHLIDDFDTVFSLRIVEGNFPDVTKIINSFETTIPEVQLPPSLKEVVEKIGDIAENPLEDFRAIEINLLGDRIECHVDKSGLSVTKSIEFEGGEVDASFLISSPMLVFILGITSCISINNDFALFSGDDFSQIICLMQST